MADVETKAWANDAISQDTFLGGKVSIFQPRQGFRAGTDSVLLAASLPDDITGLALEVGCGAGGALLPAAWRLPKMSFTGLEIDPRYAALAKRGILENAFCDRVLIQQGNAASLPPDWQNRFDLVFSNPPFFELNRTQAPAPGKTGAYIESVPLKAWINAMLFALRPKGTFVLIHRAGELARILTGLERQAGEISVRPIHSFPGGEAKRILIRARKGLRPGPLRLLEPLYLYKRSGGERSDWTVRMQQDGLGIAW